MGTHAQYNRTNEHTGWGRTHNVTKRTNTHNFGTVRTLYIDYVNKWYTDTDSMDITAVMAMTTIINITCITGHWRNHNHYIL